MYPSLRSVLRYKILVQTFKEMYESVYHYYRENVDCQCQQSQWPLKRCFRIALRQSDFSIFMKNGLIPSSGKKSGDQCNNSVCHIFRFLSEFSFTAIHCISANNFKKINCNSHLCCPYFSKILSGYIHLLIPPHMLLDFHCQVYLKNARAITGPVIMAMVIPHSRTHLALFLSSSTFSAFITTKPEIAHINRLTATGLSQTTAPFTDT